MINSRSMLPSLLVACVASTACISTVQAQVYEVQYTNRARQTLTSPVCAVHRRGAQLFEIGTAAPPGLATLAEDGDESAFAAEAQALSGVHRVASGSFVSSSSEGSIEISSRRGQRLSCVFGMLVATNDAFAAVRGVRLPQGVGESVSFRGSVYDAGSEVNTESCEHVPGGPCDAHFVGISENGTVQIHLGIQGIANLSPEQHGWPRAVVRGTITRVR